MAEKDDLHRQALSQFRDAESAEQENRAVALEAIKFARLGEQWPNDIRKQRQRDGRPCLTINKLPAIARQVINDFRQNKPSIQVHAADDTADPETAQVFAGLIRNIEYQSNSDAIYDTALEAAVYGGFGYIRAVTEYAYDEAVNLDIRLKRVANPFSIYGDPNGREVDSSDWDVAFVVDEYTETAFKKQWGDKALVDWSDTAWTEWRSVERGVVRVAEWWTREDADKKIVRLTDGTVLDPRSMEDPTIQLQLVLGQIQVHGEETVKTKKVRQRFVSGAEVLEEKEWLGRYIPIIPVYGEEIDVEGKRYFRPLLYNAIDPQRNFNYQRSAATELIALAPKVPFIGPKNAFNTDIDKWQTANTHNWPFIEYDGNIPPQRQPMDTGRAAGALQEALAAADDIKQTTGIFDASLGARSNETSGKAILARQQEGDVSTFHFIDNASRAIRHTGVVLIDLIPKVYSSDQMVRILGEDGKQGMAHVGPQPGVDERTGAKIHALGVGKYDLAVKTGPSFTTQREAASAFMTELIRAMPQAAPVIAPELFKAFDYPGADKIAEKLASLEQQQVPEQVQKQLQDMQSTIAQLQEENQKLKMDKSEKMIDVQADYALGQQKLAQEFELGQQKIEADKAAKFYTAQANAAAQASRPVVQKPANQAR